MNEMRLISLRGLSPHDYYPILEAVISSVRQGISPDTLLFVQFSKGFVAFGKNININRLVKLDYCKDNEIPVIRSFLGSSSAYHDSRTIKCLLILNQESKIITDKHTLPALLSKFIVDVLENLGLEATRRPKKNDLFLGGKKIGTGTLGHLNGTIVFSVNILVESSVEMAEKTIITTKDMKSTSTAIVDELNREVSTDEVFDAIKSAFTKTFNFDLKESSLSSEEEVLKEKMAEKYSSESWLKYGKWSPVKEYWRPQ